MDNRSKTSGFYRYFPLSERDRKWGLYVTTLGESRILPHERYPPSGHPKGYDFDWSHGRVLPDHQVVYISKGRGWFEVEGMRRHRLEAGSVFLLFPGVWHRYTPEAETGWEEHWVGFAGEIAERWVASGFFSPKEPVLASLDEEGVMGFFRLAMEAVRTNVPALQQVLAGIVSGMMGGLFSAQQARFTGQEDSTSAIHQVIERMQSDLAARLDVPRLSRELGVSYSWLRRTFANHTGLSPHQYLLELRLARARNLLSQPTVSVKQAAREVGFEDEHYFCRLFRRKTGVTPSIWRSKGTFASARTARRRRPQSASPGASVGTGLR